MVPDSELIERLRQILTTSDLNTTSAGAVRRQLESELGVDLSDRKKFISQLIDDIIQQNANANDNENDDNNDGDVKHEQERSDDDDNDNTLTHSDEQEQEQDKEDDDDVDEEGSDDKGTDSESLEPTKKKRGNGFTKVCSLSPPLQDLLGVLEMARTQVVKKLWVYIKENNLQDPSNRRNIKCDDKLHSIFRVNTINMFQMSKALSKHIWPLETEDECSVSRPEKQQKRQKEEDDTECSDSPPEKKQKRQKEEDDTDVKKPKRKTKQQKEVLTPKKRGSGFQTPLQLSEAFVNFLGTGETTLPRTEAVKRIWGYIKENDLQDPSDKRRILCDDKLKDLFEVDTFNGFSVTKYLKAHLSKVEQ